MARGLRFVALQHVLEDHGEEGSYRDWRVQLAQLALLIVSILFAFSTTYRSAGFNNMLDGWAYAGLSAFAGLICFARFALRRDRERLSWLLFSIALFSYSAVKVYEALTRDAAEMTGPSIVDLGRLAFYPLAYAAVVVLMRARLRDVPKSLWLDGVVGALASAALVSAVVFEAVMENAVGNHLAVITSLAYPVGDVLLLIFVVGSSALGGWRPDRSWVFLGTGLVLFAVSDMGHLFTTANNLLPEDSFVSAPWAVGIALLGLSAWRSPRQVDARVFERWTIVTMPIVFSVAALAVLTLDIIWPVPLLATILAVSAVLAGMLRLILTFHEVRSLNESRRQARTDELTQLGNRRFFYERLSFALKRRSKKRPLALMLIDLDRFKEVNDTLGHHIGDLLLRQIGPRLREALRDEDIICRLGGDEFTVIMDGADSETAQAAANRIRDALDIPFQLEGVPLRIAGSVGISLFPGDATESNTLLQHADVAMYTAKLTGSGHQFYVPGKGLDGRERLRNIEDLRRALEQRRVVVHYQPKVDALTGTFSGVEALARLIHPTRGVVPPVEFLMLAEQTGLMRIFTEQVVEVVLDDILKWRGNFYDIKVAINLSVTNLLDPEFPTYVKMALDQRNLTGSNIVFEITESTILSDAERATEAVNRLRALGCEISLDDYGTGYASLAYLRQMPLDELKLDRSFVTDLDTDPVSRAFVSSAVELAHALGLRVVAEGIETIEMWDAVRAAGCDVCQGYYFARPLPPEDFLAYLSTQVTNSPV